MHRNDITENDITEFESIIKSNDDGSNQNQTDMDIKINTHHDREITHKSTANFTIRQELLKSPYAKMKIISLGTSDRDTMQRVMQQVITNRDTFFIFYNKKMRNYTAIWFENNQYMQKILPENQVPVELEKNGGLETNNVGSINSLTQLFGCNQVSKHGKFNHRTAIVNKKLSVPADENLSLKYSYNWYMKFEDVKLPTSNITEEDRMKGHDLLMVLFREIIAQELRRLIIPIHPKTRLIPHEQKNTAYVVSKEIPGFISFSTLVKQQRPMNQKGLGGICVLALFVNETDCKLDNICINGKGETLEFDGDWCFTKLRMANKYAKGNQFVKGYNKNFNQLNFDITQEALDQLPVLPLNYTIWNYLDLIHEGQRKPNSLLLNELNQSPEAYKQFQYDANVAKLKISLLSNELIKDLIETHYLVMLAFCGKFKDFYDLTWIQSQKDELIAEVIVRKDAIKTYALQQDSFKEFLQDEQTKKIVADFADELKNFTIIQKEHLNIDIDKMLERNFSELYLSNTFGVSLV